MGTILYLVGLVCAVLAVLDIFKKNISTVGKVIASVLVLLTSWVGLLVYYILREGSSRRVVQVGGSTENGNGPVHRTGPFRWEALPYWISESDGVARGVKSLVELFVSISLPSAATLRRTLRP